MKQDKGRLSAQIISKCFKPRNKTNLIYITYTRFTLTTLTEYDLNIVGQPSGRRLSVKPVTSRDHVLANNNANILTTK